MLVRIGEEEVLDGFFVGTAIGLRVGSSVGDDTGASVGTWVVKRGHFVGTGCGARDRSAVGTIVLLLGEEGTGKFDGDVDGNMADGPKVGMEMGKTVEEDMTVGFIESELGLLDEIGKFNVGA